MEENKKTLATFSFVSLFALSFFLLCPVVSFAFGLWKPSGSPCLPKDDFNPIDTQICPYAEKGSDKPREVRLKWNISPKGGSPQVCWLRCDTTGAGRSDTCQGYSFKDSVGVGTTSVGTKLFPKDDIEINDSSLHDGNIYRAGCCALKDPNQREGDFLNRIIDFCKDGTITESQSMLVTSLTKCEVPFNIINDRLNSFQPAYITEVNFKTWATSEAIDESFQGGSGDDGDIKDAMATKQCEMEDQGQASITLTNETYRPEAIRRYFESYDKDKQAAPFDVFLYEDSGVPDQAGKFLGGHALIFLGFNNPNSSQTSSGEISFKFMNPNEPHQDSATCRPVKINSLPVRITTGTPNNYLCRYSKGLFIIKVPSDMPGVMPAHYVDLMASLKKNAIRDKTGDWLSSAENYPSIANNNSSIAPEGFCGGWSDFVLKVAYLGDFVGTDYHINDNKVIGADCDPITHHPIVSKSAYLPSSNWLANLWSMGRTWKLF